MDTGNKNILATELRQAVQTIKTAILQSQSRAARMISGAQLSLYFGVGLYVSANSREGRWGTGAIKRISDQLQRELPGLRGFSEESIKKMRTFAEFWCRYINRSPVIYDEWKNSGLSVQQYHWHVYICECLCHLQRHYFVIGPQARWHKDKKHRNWSCFMMSSILKRIPSIFRVFSLSINNKNKEIWSFVLLKQ